jgi:hypothetical protein
MLRDVEGTYILRHCCYSGRYCNVATFTEEEARKVNKIQKGKRKKEKENAKCKIEENKELLAMLNACRLTATYSIFPRNIPPILHYARSTTSRPISDDATTHCRHGAQPYNPGSQTRAKGKKKTESHINNA